MDEQALRATPPEWVLDFFGGGCAFLIVGWRMGLTVLEYLEMERGTEPGVLFLTELGEGHPRPTD